METLVARDEFACLLFAAIFLPFFRRKLARYSPSVSIYLGTNQTVFRIVLFLSRHFYALVGPFFFFSVFFNVEPDIPKSTIRVKCIVLFKILQV